MPFCTFSLFTANEARFLTVPGVIKHIALCLALTKKHWELTPPFPGHITRLYFWSAPSPLSFFFGGALSVRTLPQALTWVAPLPTAPFSRYGFFVDRLCFCPTLFHTHFALHRHFLPPSRALPLESPNPYATPAFLSRLLFFSIPEWKLYIPYAALVCHLRFCLSDPPVLLDKIDLPVLFTWVFAYTNQQVLSHLNTVSCSHSSKLIGFSMGVNHHITFLRQLRQVAMLMYCWPIGEIYKKAE